MTVSGLRPVELVIATGGRRIYRVDDTLLPSVTTLLRAVAKPALPGWAARATAEWVVANLDTMVTLAAADTQAAVDVAKGAPWRTRDAAGARGSEAHRLISSGIRADQLAPDDPLRPVLAGWESWLVDSGATVVVAEMPVASVVHGWAGTVDAVLDFDGDLRLVDLKTSRSVVDRDGRLYPEMPLQVAAYAACEWGPLEITSGSIVHLEPSGATEHPAFVADDLFDLEWATEADWGPTVAQPLSALVAVMDAVRVVAEHVGLADTGGATPVVSSPAFAAALAEMQQKHEIDPEVST